MQTNVYYWEFRDAVLAPSMTPIEIFVFGQSAEGAIVSAVKMADVLRRLLGCEVSTGRVAEIVEHYLCAIPPRKFGHDGAFVLYHAGTSIGASVDVRIERRPRGGG